MYGKIFKQMYKGTLAMVGPWEALVTFQQMIVLADKDGIVDMTADAISRETTIPLKIITKGIEALEQPDPESRSPDEEGRRIVLLSEDRSWGWKIVNYDYYRKLRNEEERREYHRQYYRENRSKSATKKNSTAPQQNSTDSTNSSKQNAVSRMQNAEPSTIVDGTENPVAHEKTAKTAEDAVIWDAGVRMLGAKSSRSLIGKWVSEFGKELVAGAICKAIVAKPVEPKAYIVAILQDRPKNQSNLRQNIRILQDWVNESN